MRTFTLQTSMIAPRELPEVFAFFGDPANLEAITPPWLHFAIVDMSDDAIRAGTRIRYRLRLHGLPLGWTTLISCWEPPHRFVDEQQSGPYRRWVHTHSFTACEQGTRVDDRVEYAMFGGWLADRLLVRRDLTRIFAYRQARLAELAWADPRG